jgi:hypothetical protein
VHGPSSRGRVLCWSKRPMSKKLDAPKPNDDAAPEVSRSPARKQASTEERRQIIQEYATSLRELIARLFRKRLH